MLFSDSCPRNGGESDRLIDRTGELREDSEIDEAIQAVETIMVKHATVLPLFTIFAGTIRDCLFELKVHRLKAKVEAQQHQGERDD